MHDAFGSFLADGELGNAFRHRVIEPIFRSQGHIEIDFSGVSNMTDSFAHACIGNLLTDHPEALEDGRIQFSNCSPIVRDFLEFAVSLAGQDIAVPA